MTKKMFAGIGGIAVGAMIVGLISPRTAHAVVATLVQVANTTSNPVPNLDTERIGRIPYESTSQPTGTCPVGSGVQVCGFAFPAPPSGYRLVVQNVSGWLTLEGSASAVPFAVLSEIDGFRNTFWSFTGTLGQPDNTVTQASFNQTTLAVFDAGESPGMSVTADFRGGIGQFMTLSGYLENCAVTGCPLKMH